MKKFLMLLACGAISFSAFACDDSGSDDKDKFKVPAYTEGAECGNDFNPFCDGNVLVKCKSGKVTKEDCGSDTCIWFPDMATDPDVDAEDIDEDDIAMCEDKFDSSYFEECKTEGEKLDQCHEGEDFTFGGTTEHIEATVTHRKCMAANNGKMYYRFLKSDTYCDGDACSEDKKSCGK